MNKRKAIVIGSGFGGLAMAIRLQAAGIQTKIIEKRDLAGGRAYVFKDKGFTFDAGPTVITAPQCIEELFHLSNKSMNEYVTLKPVDPFYRLYWEDGFTFDYSSSETKLKDQILKKSPADWAGYQKFFEYSREVFKQGYEELVAVPFLNFWSMIKVAPQLVSLSAHRSVYSMVAKYIKDPQLRQAFSFHSLLVGGNPFHSSSIYTLIHFLERNWGVYFPVGGTGALVQALVRLFSELGGEVLYNSEVDEILTTRGHASGVRLKGGQVHTSDLVVSNGDVAFTYNNLLRNEPLARRKAKQVSKNEFSMSLFLIYFGTNKKYENIKHHNVFFGPRYKELLSDIFKRGVVADDFSLYLHAPTKSDPNLAPEGCESFYVLSPVPHLGHSDVNWDEFGPIYANKIISYLEKHYMPGLKESIVTQRLFTPFDFRDDLKSHLGSAFSLAPTLTQSAYFRTRNSDRKISGLYFVGAGTHPGAGVPGVINSAKATYSVISNDLQLADSAVEKKISQFPEYFGGPG